MSKFREIPSIDRLRQRPGVRALETRFGADATIDALRTAAASARRAIATGSPASAPETADEIEAAAAAFLGDAFRPSLVPVINATGVVIHTNLGRAPLSPSALARVVDVASGYSSLEYDLGRGSRGRRDVHAEPLLCRLTGAEAAVVVNNNAAATLLVLAAIAAGREVIVSRGELVEIGGGFRVPDVMAQSGAVLREVGTTNKTRAADYAAAVNERTALILRVHPSNFRIEGFTERPSLSELVEVGKKCQIPVAEDLGSGYLIPVSDTGLTPLRPVSDTGRTPVRLDEPTVTATVAAGVDVCCFSGDKLLGGPQAGIIVGRAVLVDRIRSHPLMRALRVDKMTYAALEATLVDYAAGRADTAVPVRRMLTQTADEIRARADALASAIGTIDGWHAEVVDGVSAVGGGSAPGVELPTWPVSIARDGVGPDALETRLRGLTPPIVARIERGRLLLDLRTVLPEQDRVVAELLRQI
ncbi:MAG TPA: L-seryl-tRNA(Sec) selenium transferase [Vicinamibacterales bacterium]|nr:L-seryl-tRNA(Sec) selenium transferase [Vicinamibacterales bacterium]